MAKDLPDASIEDTIEYEGFTAFTMVPEWVTCSTLSAAAKQAYTTLMMHRNAQTGRTMPSRERLAALLHRGVRAVDGYLAELAAIGALSWVTVPTSTGRRNRYTLKYNPPADYDGPKSHAEWDLAWKAKMAAQCVERADKIAGRRQAAYPEPAAQGGPQEQAGGGRAENDVTPQTGSSEGGSAENDT